MRDFSHCSKLNPASCTPHYNGALVKHKLGDDKSALRWLTRAIAVDPEDPELYKASPSAYKLSHLRL